MSIVADFSHSQVHHHDSPDKQDDAILETVPVIASISRERSLKRANAHTDTSENADKRPKLIFVALPDSRKEPVPNNPIEDRAVENEDLFIQPPAAREAVPAKRGPGRPPKSSYPRRGRPPKDTSTQLPTPSKSQIKVEDQAETQGMNNVQTRASGQAVSDSVSFGSRSEAERLKPHVSSDTDTVHPPRILPLPTTSWTGLPQNTLFFRELRAKRCTGIKE